MVIRRKEEAKVAVFIDGPNLLRKDVTIDLKELKKIVKKYGRLVIGKVFLNQFAPQKLIEAIINEGFEPIIVLGEKEDSDVDVAMAVAALEAIFKFDVDYIGVATRDTDFLPVIKKAKEYGKKVIVFGVQKKVPPSLKNSADFVEII